MIVMAKFGPLILLDLAIEICTGIASLAKKIAQSSKRIKADKGIPFLFFYTKKQNKKSKRQMLMVQYSKGFRLSPL